CLGYKAEMIQSAYGHNDHGLSIAFSVESKPLGTAGALKHAERLISGESFLLLNGDSLVEVEYARLLRVHESNGAEITLTLVRTQRPERYGTAVLDANGEISAFVEKGVPQAVNGNSSTKLINAGAYVIKRSVLDAIPATGSPVSLERDI